jgi:hypothetical protein
MSAEEIEMPDKSALNLLNWGKVEAHFLNRVQVSAKLIRRHNNNQIRAFAELAIGSEEDTGNYSAAEHRTIRPGIAENPNWLGRVYTLAGQFKLLTDASVVPDLISRAKIKYLQIGVGSEMSCMVNPDICWVCNVRTIWLHLAWTKSPGKAEEELKQYREGASESDMAYMRWAEVYHPRIWETLVEVAAEGEDRVRTQEIVVPAGKRFLWADAIAAYAYDSYHGK